MRKCRKKITLPLNKILPFVLAALIVTLSACSTAASEESFSVTIFHTNDHHGQTLAYKSNGSRTGGLAERVALIKSLKEEASAKCDLCLILDAGDISSGTLFSDSYSAEPDWKIFGKFYDVLTLGNHDFDFPLDTLLRFIDSFGIPVISANLYDSLKGTLLFPPYKIFRKDGWSVAVIGLSHPDTPIISTLGNDERLEFRSPLKAADSFVKNLRDENDMVIILSHWGEEDLRLAQKTKGVDLIVGGHSHTPLAEPIKKDGALIINAGSQGRFVGRLALRLLRKGRSVDIEMTDYELIPVRDDIPPDREVESLLKPYVDAFGSRGQKVVGEAGGAFLRAPISGAPSSSTLANLVADAYRQVSGADFAFVNRGGLRADLNKGPVSVDDLHAILPFDNTLIVFDVRGSQILDIISNMAGGAISENGLLLPSNLLITGLRSGQMEVCSGDGQPLIPDKIYRLAVGSFIARGGDGHAIFPTLKDKYDTMIRTSDALGRYIEAKKIVYPDNKSRLK